ncbi:hypothetical protein AAVH_10268 [Aphelenchoides avenae]|nr:hypothetical protein AAVH_10268 [Aphelenchus avenae]
MIVTLHFVDDYGRTTRSWTSELTTTATSRVRTALREAVEDADMYAGGWNVESVRRYDSTFDAAVDVDVEDTVANADRLEATLVRGFGRGLLS